MPLLDKIQDLASRFAPAKHGKSSVGGIGSGGHGMVPVDDDMIVSKPVIVMHASQIFFNFLAMACFASVASFQAKWKIGPSGLSGFALFTSIAGMFLSAFMLFVPVAYERYDKFVRLARALKEVRVGFILTGTGVTFSLLIAFIVTISAWTEPGCKNAENDPHAEGLGDDFKKGLPGWCNTKKAAAVFFWFVFGFWAASLVLLVLDWRSGKLHGGGRRDPPFQRPQSNHDEEEGEGADEEEDELDGGSYTHVPPVRRTTASGNGMGGTRYENEGSGQSPFADPYPSQQQQQQRYGGGSTPYTPAVHQPLAGRPSMDAYGAFSDPAPSGFGSAAGYTTTNAAQQQQHSSANISTGYSGLGRDDSPVRSTQRGPPVLAEPDMGGPMVSRTMQYADPYAAVRASIAGQQPGSPTGGAPPPGYDAYSSGYR